jgi:transposase
MKHLTPQHKHSILLEYQPRSHDHSFAALAARHGIEGRGKIIQRWHQQWDGRAASLEEKRRIGRPRILTTQQVQQYVAPMICEKNRRAERVRYSDIHSAVQAETNTQMSLRTLQHYGKEELGAHKKHGKKRTADESQSTHTYYNR